MTEIEQFNTALERLFTYADRIPEDARQLFAEYLLTGSPPVTTPDGKRDYLSVRADIRGGTEPPAYTPDEYLDPIPRATVYLLYLLETMEFPGVVSSISYCAQNTKARPEWHRKAAAALDKIGPIT